MSPKTVQRTIDALAGRGLLTVVRAGSSKFAPVAEYDLGPLWDALAAVVRAARPSLTVVEGGQADQQGGQSDQPRVVRVTSEVDEVEVDEVELERERAHAHDDVPLWVKLRRDAEDPSVFPWKREQILRRADEERALYDRGCAADAAYEDEQAFLDRLEAAEAREDRKARRREGRSGRSRRRGVPRRVGGSAGRGSRGARRTS